MSAPKLNPATLKPGDILLYKPSGIAGWIIAAKTWNWVSHVEVYADFTQAADGSAQHWAFAARAGKGVYDFPFDPKGIAYVLRPPPHFDFERAKKAFFEGIDGKPKYRGQGYDWMALLNFALGVKLGSKTRQICSAVATRLMRDGLFFIFGKYDANRISPAQFLMAGLDQIYPPLT